MGKNRNNNGNCTKINRTAKLSRLKKIIASLDKLTNGKDVDISYEYICASLFPGINKEIDNNIREFGLQQFALGYKYRQEEEEKEKIEG